MFIDVYNRQSDTQSNFSLIPLLIVCDNILLSYFMYYVRMSGPRLVKRSLMALVGGKDFSNFNDFRNFNNFPLKKFTVPYT